MNLYTIHAGYFKLDGGAMFGVVPKTIWKNLNPPDENNLCTWAMRCLLVETGDRKILIDSGIGNKQGDKFFKHYEPHGPENLESSLAAHGFSPDDITDHVLTHLHFDHCGGSIALNQDGTDYEPYFKNATYHVSRPQWESAMAPNPREKASMLKENIVPMQEKGPLNFVEADAQEKELFPGFKVRFVNGHTDGMMIPMIDYHDKTIAYMADLLPSTYHLRTPFVMAFDIRPLDSMQEKPAFLEEAHNNNYTLFFEHDPVTECCTLQEGKKGYEVEKEFKLEAIKT